MGSRVYMVCELWSEGHKLLTVSSAKTDVSIELHNPDGGPDGLVSLSPEEASRLRDMLTSVCPAKEG